MKIIELTAENVKRLRAIDITPDEHLQVVAGRNAQGKTSVLDAIWLALGGGTASKATARPIRDGEDTARVRLDLGDLVVTRTWTGDKTTLRVESSDGARYSSPQGVLDALVGRLSFDPLAFTHLSARDQVGALLDIVDLPFDPAALDRRRADLFEDRTRIGRDGKAAEGPDLGVIESRMATVDETNAAVRAKAERARVAAAVADHRARYDAKTAEIDALDQEKADGLAAATFPIASLGFDEQGVTYQGVPFSQASSAEQIRVSLAMAMALNPDLRVIRILDGSLLDADNLALIGEMAREHDYQVWVERVGNGDGVGVVIEDGAVAR